MTNTYSDIPQLNDPKISEKIKKAVQDISNQYTMIESYKANIKAAIDAVSEDTDVPKKIVRKLARTYHRQTFQTEIQENEEFVDVYEKVFGSEG